MGGSPVPELLDLLDIEGHTISLDTMGWVLDVVWDEDASRIRKKNAAQNVALMPE